MSKLIKLFDEAKVGDIVMYPTCEVSRRYSNCGPDSGHYTDVSYSKPNGYVFRWKVYSVNKERGEVFIKAYETPYYISFLKDEKLQKNIEIVKNSLHEPIMVPISDFGNEQYAIIYDEDYAVKTLVSSKDRIHGEFNPIIFLRQDIMAVETKVKVRQDDDIVTTEKAWDILPVEITDLEEVKKCVRNKEYQIKEVRKLKFQSVLETLVGNVDEKYWKDYIVMLQKNNPETTKNIMELANYRETKELADKILRHLMMY